LTVPKKKSPKHKKEVRALAGTQGVEARRDLVTLYLKQHLTHHEIAVKLDVKTSTIEQDITAIDKASLGVHKADLIGRKQRELAELDEMEALIIKVMNTQVKQLEVCLKEPEFNAKEIKARTDNVIEWFDKRLQVKRDRAKWLGFEKSETESAGVEYQDNRSVVMININGIDHDFVDVVDQIVNAEHKELNSGN